ncbi:hypothetical protein NFI96_029755, partial [Prochilodus magdalenae]
ERLIKDPGWRYFNSSFYYSSTERKSWSESRENCTERGAEMVMIDSREEQDFINRLRGDQTAWIGLSYRNTEGGWRWVDGSSVTTGFWKHRQPHGHGHCAVTGYGPDPVQNWAEYLCSDQRYWICVKRVFRYTTACE